MNKINDRLKKLKGNCSKCFGLCCVALFCSKTDGFPKDKEAGKPCINLQDDFKCKVHEDLNKKGYRGCIAYDCFGAGQIISQATFKGESWNDENKDKMFQCFLIVRQICEMMHYLLQALKYQENNKIKSEIENVINETEKLIKSDTDSLLKIDLIVHRSKVNKLLKKTSDEFKHKFNKSNVNTLSKMKRIAGRLNLIASDLKKINLVGQDLSGALLIAADLKGCDLSGCDLLGADLRDANICSADLSRSIYITQTQINSAIGNKDTKLPENIIRPTERWI